MNQSTDIKRVVDKLFDVLTDVKVPIAIEALSRVIKEFERAKDEPDSKSGPGLTS